MSKKTLILISCLVLSLTIGLGGSLAYLTDTDTKVNTFTMGKVEIKVDEVFDEENADLKPGIDINKDARIVNTGDNDAWVWMTVAVPEKADPAITLGWNNVVPEKSAQPMKGADGENYYVYTVGITTPLKAKEATAYLLDKVTLKSNVDYRDGAFWLVNEGDDTKVEYDLTNLDIIVTGYAIQADGIDDIATAVQNYGGQWGFEPIPTEESTSSGEPDEPDQPTNPDHPTEPEEQWTEVATLDALCTAVAAGGNIKLMNDIEVTEGTITIPANAEVVLDLNGHKLHSGVANILTNNGTLTIKGGTVGGTYSGYVIMNYEKLTIVDTIVEHSGSAEIRNYEDGTELTIKGNSVVKHAISNQKNVEVKVVIEGGTFSFDPSAYVPTGEGYTVTLNPDNTWTVSK